MSAESTPCRSKTSCKRELSSPEDESELKKNKLSEGISAVTVQNLTFIRLLDNFVQMMCPGCCVLAGQTYQLNIIFVNTIHCST